MGGGHQIHNHLIRGRGGDIRVRDYVPRVTVGAPFLWVHGGGFHSGHVDTRESDAPARYLADRGRWVRTIDYRLAPRVGLTGAVRLGAHPGRFPAGHDDVVDVARSLVAESGCEIHLGGASAGASLAAGAAMALRDVGGELVRSLVCAYGTFHAELPANIDIEDELRGPIARWAFNPGQMSRMNINYVGSPDALTPGYAFPGGAPLVGMPPALVLDARNDRLRRSGAAFADELRAADVEVQYEVVNAMHAFLGKPGSVAFAKGMTTIGSWLDRFVED